MIRTIEPVRPYGEVVIDLIDACGFKADGSHLTPEATARRRNLLNEAGIAARVLGLEDALPSPDPTLKNSESL